VGKTLYSNSASLHPGVEKGTGKLNAESKPAMDWCLIQGGVEILPVTTYYTNWDKLRPDGPLARKQTLPLPYKVTTSLGICLELSYVFPVLLYLRISAFILFLLKVLQH